MEKNDIKRLKRDDLLEMILEQARELERYKENNEELKLQLQSTMGEKDALIKRWEDCKIWELIEQVKELEKIKTSNTYLQSQIDELNEHIIKIDREKENLRQQLETIEEFNYTTEELVNKIKLLEDEKNRIEQELNDRRIKIANAGSIAEAALQVNGIFEIAQKSADDYLKSLNYAIENQDAILKQKEKATLDELEKIKKQTLAECELEKKNTKISCEKYRNKVEVSCEEMKKNAQEECRQMKKKTEKDCNDRFATIQSKLEGIFKDLVMV